MKPFLRWAGGKSWLASALAEEISLSIKSSRAKTTVYVEPFLGGGAVALALKSLVDDSTRFELSDANTAVMAVWDTAISYPEVLAEQVERILSKVNNTKEGYHEIRDEFNAIEEKRGTTYAALALALNRMAFNGLWRENKSGEMNVPFGDVKKPSTFSAAEFIEVSSAFCDDNLWTSDFRGPIANVWERPGPGYFLYIDPPYHDGYVSYVADGFTEDDQRDLASQLKKAAEAGAKVWANNSDTPFIREIYSWADVRALEEPRAIAAKASSRKNAACLIIRNR